MLGTRWGLERVVWILREDDEIELEHVVEPENRRTCRRILGVAVCKTKAEAKAKARPKAKPRMKARIFAG